MESYALAETFKYLYLLFMPDYTLQVRVYRVLSTIARISFPGSLTARDLVVCDSVSIALLSLWSVYLCVCTYMSQHTRARYRYLKARSAAAASPESGQMASSLHAKYTQKDLDVFVFNTEAHPLWIGDGCSGSCQSTLEGKL